MRFGATFVPLDPYALRRENEIRALVSGLGPAVVLTRNSSDAEQYDCFGGLEKLKVCCTGSLDSLPAWRGISDLQTKSITPAPLPASNPTRTVMLMLTSGTTRLPKGCPVTELGMVAQITQYHQLGGGCWDADTKMLINTMCFRPICYLASLSAWQRGGMVVFVSDLFDAEASLRAIISQRCTHTWMVPAQLSLTAAVSERTGCRATELKLVLVSGDTVTRDTITRAEEALQPRRLLPTFGMSEGAPLFGYRENEAPSTRQKDPQEVGPPLPGTRVRICEPGTTSVVPRGTTGDLHVNSESVIHHYFQNEQPEVFYDDDQGRWFITGDLASMNESGLVSIVGRTKDLIKCDGIGIVPSVLEDYLSASFDTEVSFSPLLGQMNTQLILRQFKVVGISDPIRGAVPVAVVPKLPQTDAGIGADMKRQIKDLVIQLFSSQYALDVVYEFSELGLVQWPRNSSDKIMRSDLVDSVDAMSKRS